MAGTAAAGGTLSNEEERVCPKCHNAKPVQDFASLRGQKDNKRCRACQPGESISSLLLRPSHRWIIAKVRANLFPFSPGRRTSQSVRKVSSDAGVVSSPATTQVEGAHELQELPTIPANVSPQRRRPRRCDDTRRPHEESIVAQLNEYIARVRTPTREVAYYVLVFVVAVVLCWKFL